MKEKIYKNRKKLSLIALAITIAGGINTYKFYGQEPHETIGGFLVGAGLGLFLIFISLKHPEEKTSNE